MSKKSANSDGEMTFLEHLEEMRSTILKSLAVFVIALIGVGTGFSYFNNVMLYPLNTAKKVLATYDKLSGNEPKKPDQKLGPVFLVKNGNDGKEQKLGPYFVIPKDDSVVLVPESQRNNWYDSIKLRSMTFATPIIVWFYVSFLGALGISFPFILYFVIQFVAPGLTKEEKSLLRPGLFAAVILFCIGVSFAFMFMLPMGIAFMSWMSQSWQMEMFPDAQSYYSMVVFLTLAVGIIFEMPLVLTILIYLGVLNPDWLKKNRKIVFIVILVFASVITPPDFITQLSLTFPLYLMYEIALRVGTKMRAKKLAKEAAREREEEIQDEKERKEYAKQIAKERIEEQKQEEAEERSIDKSHYGDDSIPDDYDPNNIDEENNPYGYSEDDDFNEEDYGLEPYIDYGSRSRPAPDLGPNWDLNRPDTSFMSPDWDLNSDKPAAEIPSSQPTETVGDSAPDLNASPKTDDNP